MDLPNGVVIPPEDYFIWDAYSFKCLMCIYKLAVTLHECPPKSLNPHWMERPETRFPLCEQHHKEAHEKNWKVMNALLINNRNAYFPDAEEKLKQHGK